MVLLMLVMGVASPYWMRAINERSERLANSATQTRDEYDVLAEKR